jgi:preprotein translocase subunit SecA
MLSQIYSGRTGDSEIIENYYQNFQKLNDEELSQKCIEAKKQGIFGVHRQSLYLIALFKAAKDRGISAHLDVQTNGVIFLKNNSINQQLNIKIHKRLI